MFLQYKELSWHFSVQVSSGEEAGLGFAEVLKTKREIKPGQIIAFVNVKVVHHCMETALHKLS